MTLPYLVTKSEFADLCGVTRGAISNAARRGLLRGALVHGRIDLESEAALAYLAKHRFAEWKDDDQEGPCDVPEEFLRTRDDIPLARAYLARLSGQVPTDEAVASMLLYDVQTTPEGKLDLSDPRFRKFMEAGAVLFVDKNDRITGVRFAGRGNGRIYHETHAPFVKRQPN